MPVAQEQFEIMFRLQDGSDIGPFTYPTAATVATLKESIIAHWPKEKGLGPRSVNDLKLIISGKILENSKTLVEYKSSTFDFSGVTTMLVIIRPPPPPEKNSDKITRKKHKDCSCVCAIL
uniref:Membrane-anchored ubiquitin-fold protein n=1 Tax=Ananas comosus var. bracteatus TaxID=296719 RepID=A0A6V7PNG9_ANACO|nr:unnamed protein product [Ananas comosus var. bracteatus]